MNKTELEIKNHLPNTTVDLNKAFILNEKTLQLRTREAPFEPDENLITPIERKFKFKLQLERIVVQNGKVLFGANSLLIDTKVKTNIEFSGYQPDAILFDLNEQGKPKCYFIETMLVKQDFFGFLFPRMTGFFAQRNNKEMVSSLIELMCKIISKNHHLKKKLQSFIAEEEVVLFVNRMLLNTPLVLLITDGAILELPEIIQVYGETWGKRVKPLVLRKFSANKESYCYLSPDFDDIDKEKDTVKVKVVKSTEDDHFKNSSDGIRDSYSLIKAELLTEDETIEFNPKQYYISVRKNRNLAFFHISKKKITLVLVNPEKETRKVIKHHVVKTLTEKVQKFWNGPSCSVIIENTDNLNEVITLLKKLVAKS